MRESRWARRFVADDDGEPELVDVTPAAPIGAWLLSEMAKHRADAGKRRTRTMRYAIRTACWWLATLLPLPFWANLTAFTITVALGLATFLEAERWLSSHLAARAEI